MQSVSDGKSIIIEGFHLDPALYLKEFDMKAPLSHTSDSRASDTLHTDAALEGANREQTSNLNEGPIMGNNSTNSLMLGDHAALFLESTEDGTTQPIVASNLDKSAAIFIPLILDIPAEDYETDAQAWLEEILQMAGHSSGRFGTISNCCCNSNRAIDRMHSIQRYIRESSLDSAVPCITLDIFNLDSSLDQIHEYIIACIERSLRDE